MSTAASSLETSFPSTKSGSSSVESSNSESLTPPAADAGAEIPKEVVDAVEQAAAEAAAEHISADDPDAAFVAAVEATKPEPTPEYLHVIGECAAPCGLAESEWHRGVKMWRCDACGFQTFDEDAALKRMAN